MPRNIFISFLGTSNYEPVRYFNREISDALLPVRFVQEASISFHCRHFSGEDEILIFTTEQAFEKNWKDYEHLNFKTKEKEPRAGLEHCLQERQLSCQWSNVSIPNGESTDEIWEIFNIVFDKIQEGDHLYFDITHGFRSIPMLNMVLMNYAKLLKNIVVRGIFYGAFEAKVKNEAGEDCAPIWDLTPFAELQDWSIAAHTFVESGITSEIVKLTKEKIAPTLRETKGQDAAARVLSLLSNSLEKLEGDFSTNRGQEIVDGKLFDQIKLQLEKLSSNRVIIQPLKPILEKLEKKISNFSGDNRLNWLAGAKWCLEHNLIQQGVTQLQEGLITQAILETKGIIQLDYTDFTHREIVRQSFIIRNKKIAEKDWMPPSRNNVIVTRSFQKADIIEHLYKAFQKLTDLRNDINHGGYLHNTPPKKFKENFGLILEEVEKYFQSKK